VDRLDELGLAVRIELALGPPEQRIEAGIQRLGMAGAVWGQMAQWLCGGLWKGGGLLECGRLLTRSGLWKRAGLWIADRRYRFGGRPLVIGIGRAAHPAEPAFSRFAAGAA